MRSGETFCSLTLISPQNQDIADAAKAGVEIAAMCGWPEGEKTLLSPRRV